MYYNYIDIYSPYMIVQQLNYNL